MGKCVLSSYIYITTLSRVNMLKLKAETRTILTKTIPNWMQKLCAVNFDIQKIHAYDRLVMESDHTKCFIGELHNNDVSYVRTDDDGCRICYVLSLCAPIVFNSVDSIQRKDTMDFYNTNGFGRNASGVKKFLNYTADHIREKHMDLVKVKTVRNECQ